MKRSLILILGVCCLWSCTSRTIYKKPENLVEKEKMIEIWTDLYLASAARNVKIKTLETNIDYIPLVLEKHQIDSLQFNQSNFYYTSRIEEYEKMFEVVQERLQVLKETYDPETALDSILESNRAKLLEEKIKN